ncbi:MAG TPA: hypothetical protein PL041_01435 [Melioribacteraceae bacterium]|nr:hypothetical protein [Melioribacteraceae bacterium]
MKYIKYFLMLLVAFCIGCEDEPIENMQGKVTKYGECKNSTNFYKSNVTRSESCIYFTYNGTDKLILKHINAGFNCCPNGIYTTISLNGNKLIINEHENSNDCRCLCLYDIEMEVNNINPGNYTIIINEPYAEYGPPLEFDANLTTIITDSVCVARNYYPWGYN